VGSSKQFLPQTKLTSYINIYDYYYSDFAAVAMQYARQYNSGHYA
jgi:hypothetical protein